MFRDKMVVLFAQPGEYTKKLYIKIKLYTKLYTNG